jgi:hypothetical protein
MDSPLGFGDEEITSPATFDGDGDGDGDGTTIPDGRPNFLGPYLAI